jgi:IS5 family transposase
MRRRSAVEPVIGYMKEDGKLGRNWLKGSLGDKINALLCGAGHNMRIILRRLRELLSLFVLFALFGITSREQCRDWGRKNPELCG